MDQNYRTQLDGNHQRQLRVHSRIPPTAVQACSRIPPTAVGGAFGSYLPRAQTFCSEIPPTAVGGYLRILSSTSTKFHLESHQRQLVDTFGSYLGIRTIRQLPLAGFKREF